MNIKSALAIAIMTSMVSCTGSSNDEDQEMKSIEYESLQDSITENTKHKQDMEKFKKNATDTLLANEKSISQFQERINTQKKEAKAEYQEKIAELNSKNTDLKKRITDFNTQNKSTWDSFKNEFSSDMNKLGKALKDFTVKNK